MICTANYTNRAEKKNKKEVKPKANRQTQINKLAPQSLNSLLT